MMIGLNELLIHEQNHLPLNYTSSVITITAEKFRQRLIVQKKTNILFKKLGAVTTEAGRGRRYETNFQS